MKCDRCHQKEATVFLRQNINGAVSEQHLCSDCAREVLHGGQGLTGDFINSYFSQALPVGIFHDLGGIPSFGAAPAAAPARACPVCSTSEETFRKTGLVGCPACYEAFHDRMEQIFARVQASDQHTGRVYAHAACPVVPDDPTAALRAEIEQNRVHLKEAVQKEDYEEAAKIRDRIREQERRLTQEADSAPSGENGESGEEEHE